MGERSQQKIIKGKMVVTVTTTVLWRVFWNVNVFVVCKSVAWINERQHYPALGFVNFPKDRILESFNPGELSFADEICIQDTVAKNI